MGTNLGRPRTIEEAAQQMHSAFHIFACAMADATLEWLCKVGGFIHWR